VSEGRNTIRRLERSRSGRRCPLDVRMHRGHVEGPNLLDEVDKGGLRQRPRLGEHEDLLAEDHEGGKDLIPAQAPSSRSASVSTLAKTISG
jgi:hypothetical protein